MPASDYYILTAEDGERSHPWSWQIQRKSKPMGVRVRGTGFASQPAALYAGQRALLEFVTELYKQEHRRE